MSGLSLTLVAPKRHLVVVVIEDHPKAVRLLRAAQKRAEEIPGGKWRALLIETPETAEHDSAQPLQLLTRAEQMGGETERIEAASKADGLRRVLAREAGRIDRIIIAGLEPSQKRWILRHPRPWVKLVRLASSHAQVEVVPLSGQFRQSFSARLLGRLRAIEPLHLFYAIPGIAIPAALAFVLEYFFPPALFRINEENIGFLFLISCAFVAGRYGLLPGLITAIGSFVVQHYYFTLPYDTFKLDGLTDLFSVVLFLGTAILLAVFTSRMRGYMRRVEKRESRSEMLFTLYRLTAASYTRQQAVTILQENLQKMLDADVALFLPSALNPEMVEPTCPANPDLTPNDQKAMEICWAEIRTTGMAAPYNPGTRWRFEPMIAGGSEIGVLGVRVHNPRKLDAWLGRLITVTADQSAAILAQIEMERSMEATRISEEREKLRSMLLSSVSHDLKTPLAGIIGALSAHNMLGGRIRQEKRKELINGALEEAMRLDQFITNILDMTKLESGNLRFHPEWHPLRPLMAELGRQMKRHPLRHELTIEMPEGEIEAYLDPTLTMQVLQNLLDNACKYTPATSRIEVAWKAQDGKSLLCTLRDHGEGIPEENLAQIFDKYARLQKKDNQPAGTGLGLAIARAIMEGQNGWIKASNHPEGGALFTLSFPQWRHKQQQETQERYYDSRQ